MLQVIICPNERFSMAETAQMAIEAGCQWIDIHAPELSDEELRPDAVEITELCRETGTILIFEDRPELARELGVHGIYLSHRDVSPQKVREEMGPEAIIGMEIVSSSTAAGLESLDIDYAVVAPSSSEEDKNMIPHELRAAGSKMPLVARGNFTPSMIPALLEKGYSGICTRIDKADDPVAFAEELLNALAR